MELNLRTANVKGDATVKLKVTGPIDADGCVKVSCVETVTNEIGQTVVFSDDRGDDEDK